MLGSLHLANVKHRLDELIRHWPSPPQLFPLIPACASVPIDLVLRETGKKCLIEWMVVRQSELSDLICNAKLTVVLHCSRILAITFGVHPRRLACIENSAGNIPKVEEKSQAKAHGPATDDQNWGRDGRWHSDGDFCEKRKRE